MSLASWTLLFGPSGADDNAAASVFECLGAAAWPWIFADRPRYPPCEDRLHHGFFLVHVQDGQEASGG